MEAKNVDDVKQKIGSNRKNNNKQKKIMKNLFKFKNYIINSVKIKEKVKLR